MNKHAITNRHGLHIAIRVDLVEEPRGLAFVMHGLGGFKEQLHIQTFAKALKDNGYSVVLFDTTNTLGESGGKYEDATTTNYYHDLEDVITWASTQTWYQEPFVLIGHSLGGLSTALFAQTYPDKVSALAPISTVVSGLLSTQGPGRQDMTEAWKESGWLVQESVSKPGVMKRLPWSHMEDRMKYNLMPNVHKLTMPVFLAAGALDTSTPFEQQRQLFDVLPGEKELHEIKGAGHTFREQEHLDELYRLLSTWLTRLDC